MTAVQLSVFYKDGNQVLTSRDQLLLGVCTFYSKKPSTYEVTQQRFYLNATRINKDISFRDLLTIFLSFIVSSLLTIFLVNYSLILSQHVKQQKTQALRNISFVKQSARHEYNLVPN